MKTTDEVISELAAAAALDDVDFPMVLDAVRDLGPLPPGNEGMARVLSFVGVLLDRGFVPVTSPYSTPPSAPWPETARPAILQRLAREWASLQNEPTIVDLCWFHYEGR
jgi:hypothetical protein